MAKLTSGTYLQARRPLLAAAMEPELADTLREGSLIAQIKQYQVVEVVGEGGMGWVYRAYDRDLERSVALKVMKPDVPIREQLRFRREALLGARLTHPGIARVYDLVGVPGQGLMWFVMEYLPGKDLSQVLDIARTRGSGVPLPRVLDVVGALLRALQYAHECRLVHRDVKPANMFATRDPNTRRVIHKLLDFGVALDLHAVATQQLEPETQLVGDPRYMPPEQTRLGLPIDHRADLYATGMALHELVAGTHGFADLADADPRVWLAAQRERELPQLDRSLPHLHDGEVHARLDHIIRRATKKDVAERYESALDMADDLDALKRALEGVPAHA